MQTTNGIRHEIDDLKEKLAVKDKHLAIKFLFSQLDEPHGVYGSTILHCESKDGKWHNWHEAVSTEEELKELKQSYTQLLANRKNEFMRNPSHPFHSFESFLESCRCTCGKHGADGKQPYIGDKVTA